MPRNAGRQEPQRALASALLEVNGLRSLNAGNRGLFTLDGTRTFLVGQRDVCVIDPGPNQSDHLAALVSEVAGADRVRILLTHGHEDHSGLATALAQAAQAEILGSGHPDALPMVSGDVVTTDVGALKAMPLPGHTKDHLGFWWQERQALFVGDLLLGSGNTTWVAGYPNCVAEYLDSLDRVDALAPRSIFPSHGPEIADPRAAVAKFRDHRALRIEQVRAALSERPGAAAVDLLYAVYGVELPSAVRGAAEASIGAILEHIRRQDSEP